MAMNIPNQLPTGMASFNQGFKGMADFMNQIKQHQLEQQKLQELMRHQQVAEQLAKAAGGRAQAASGRNQALFVERLKKLKSENALNDYFDMAFNGKMPNNDMGGSYHEGAGSNYDGMENPNTGILNGWHDVDMNGNMQAGQQQQQQSFVSPINPQNNDNGVISPGNINLNNRPMVKNPQGGTSTVFTMGISEDGKHINIPRVSDDGRILTPKEAVDLFHKTGKHLGVYSSQQAADTAAQQLHEQQANQYGLNQNNDQIGSSQQESHMLQVLKQKMAQDPRLRGAFKKKFGYDLLAPTPQQKQDMDLETHRIELEQADKIAQNKENRKITQDIEDTAKPLMAAAHHLAELKKIIEKHPHVTGPWASYAAKIPLLNKAVDTGVLSEINAHAVPLQGKIAKELGARGGYGVSQIAENAKPSENKLDEANIASVKANMDSVWDAYKQLKEEYGHRNPMKKFPFKLPKEFYTTVITPNGKKVEMDPDQAEWALANGGRRG